MPDIHDPDTREEMSFRSLADVARFMDKNAMPGHSWVMRGAKMRWALLAYRDPVAQPLDGRWDWVDWPESPNRCLQRTPLTEWELEALHRQFEAGRLELFLVKIARLGRNKDWTPRPLERWVRCVPDAI